MQHTMQEKNLVDLQRAQARELLTNQTDISRTVLEGGKIEKKVNWWQAPLKGS